MSGEMPQMVTVRPNADAVRHQDRRGVFAIRGGKVLFRSFLTASLRSTALPGLGYVRTEFAYINHTHCGQARAV